MTEDDTDRADQELLGLDGEADLADVYETELDALSYEDGADEQRLCDGGPLHRGTRRSKLYYWVNPETDAALVHTEVGDEEAILFFDSVGAAESYLEARVEYGAEDRYETLSLYEATVQKIGDATDVLTEQTGIHEFD